LVTCGQKVKLEVSKIASEKKALNQSASGEKQELEFTVGVSDEKVSPYIQQAIMGMQIGGIREAEIGPLWFSANAKPSDEPQKFQLRLLDANPKLKEGEMPLVTVFSNPQPSMPAFCGEEISIHLEVWDSKGEKVFSTRKDNKPLNIIIGANQIAHGIDRSVNGITNGELKTLLIPPSFLVADSDKNAINLPLDRSHIAVFELERVSVAKQEEQNELKNGKE
jgi:FKBP-type peptidyl-prolyl cis-trans isomerase 2